MLPAVTLKGAWGFDHAPAPERGRKIMSSPECPMPAIRVLRWTSRRLAQGLHQGQFRHRHAVVKDQPEHIDPEHFVIADRGCGRHFESGNHTSGTLRHLPKIPRIVACERLVRRGSLSPDASRISAIQARSLAVIGSPTIS